MDETGLKVANTNRSANTFRFLGRTFLALLFTPEPPLGVWLEELDAWVARSTGFISAKPVVLDLSRLSLTQLDYIGLMTELDIRKIRIISVEGIDPSWRDPAHAPLGNGGRSSNVIDFPDPPATGQPLSDTIIRQVGNGAGPGPVCANPVEQPADSVPAPGFGSLLLETSVRSGQSVLFPNGDVTVIGSVASGAEVVAGGSIHIYGTLRGRAIAGLNGNSKARIFCGRLEAELVAVDGLYKTADDMDPVLRGQAVQVWLEDEVMKLKTRG